MGRIGTSRWGIGLALLGAAAILSGCGGGTKTVVSTVTAPQASTTIAATSSPSTTISTTSSSTSKPTDCNALGIDSKGLREGTCFTNGEKFTVVNKASTLHLRSLTAKFNGARTQNSLSAPASTATANGEFVIISLTIANKLDTPQTFDQIGTPQTALELGNKVYTEDFQAENGPDQQSFIANQLSQNGIQPGESKTGDVVFDVPSRAVSELDKTGNIIVVNFGDAAQSPSGTIGVIRTYH